MQGLKNYALQLTSFTMNDKKYYSQTFLSTVSLNCQSLNIESAFVTSEKLYTILMFKHSHSFYSLKPYTPRY